MPGAALTEKIEMAPAYVISGRVTDERGRPVANGWGRAVHTSSPDGVVSKQLLGAGINTDGTFLLPNLGAGSYTVEVRLNQGPPTGQRSQSLARENIAAGTRDLVIVVGP